MISRIRTFSIFNFIVFLVAFLVSNLSQWGLLGLNNTMATVSAKYESVFTPAGVTFAIWGIIYISLFAFCIYHLVQAFTQHKDQRVNQDLHKISWLFILNNVATSLWVFAWLSEMLWASVGLMLIQLLSLLLIHIRLEIYNPRRALFGKAFSQFPLSIYFAWICVATVANISALLVAIDWNGWGISPSNWTIILIGIITLLCLFMVYIRRNVSFAMVILWALYGIILKRQQIDATLYADVISAAWTAFILIAVSAILQFVKNIRSRPQLH